MIYYLLSINLFAFFICYLDKKKAIKHKYRISENFLLLSALLGGAFGFYISMQLFRHKTKHLKFKLLVPIFMILWIYIISQNLHILDLFKTY